MYVLCCRNWFSACYSRRWADTDELQVLRYSALVFGIFYGFQHQRTLYAQSHASHAQAEFKRKEDLIEKARLEWKKKTMSQASKKGDDSTWHAARDGYTAADTTTVITDPEDKNFDLEAYLQKMAADN